MTETDRKSHWDALYTQPDPKGLSWRQADPVVSLELIEKAGIGHDAPIIDVGGGSSRLVDRLLKAGYVDLTVLDVTDAPLIESRARLGSRAEGVA